MKFLHRETYTVEIRVFSFTQRVKNGFCAKIIFATGAPTFNCVLDAIKLHFATGAIGV